VRLSQKNGCGTSFGAAALPFSGGKIMKNKMQKTLSVLLAMMIVCTVLFTGCQPDKQVLETPASSENSDPSLVITNDYIAIKVTQELMDGATDMTLMDYMTKLKDKGELEFAISDGMITSINGTANPEDYSSCWMLYTSDADNSNASWGTVEYEGQEYGSAISGAETLKIKVDQLYIWVFKSFS
jgi:preprotein translocase subunit SecG